MLSPPFERAKDPDSDAHEFEYWSLLSPYPKIVPAEMLADKTSFLMPSFVLNSSPVQALSVMKISDPTGIFFNATITTVSGLFELTPVSMISPALKFPVHVLPDIGCGGDVGFGDGAIGGVGGAPVK